MTDDNENVVADPYLDKYYRMDPETEDLLVNGNELRDGMLVTFAESKMRTELIQDPSPKQLNWILQRNRWFTVSKVQVEGELVRYVAEYKDGHKEVHSWDVRYSYYVVKDSIPVEEPKQAHNRIPVVGRCRIATNLDGTNSVFIDEENGTVTEFVVTPIDPVAMVESQKTFKELVDMDQPVVNPRAPFFPTLRDKPLHETNLGLDPKWNEPGAKAEDGSDYKTPPTLENLKKNDPGWAIRNLQKNATPVQRDFGWADPTPTEWKEDPTPTHTDIPVFKEPIIHVVQPDPTEGPQNEMGVDVPEYQPTDLQKPKCAASVVDLVDSSSVVHRCVLDADPVHYAHTDGKGLTWAERSKDEQWLADGADDQPQD